MDEATRAQLIGQIEGLEQAKCLIVNRPTANACSILLEIEDMMSSLRGELLDAAGMRRPSSKRRHKLPTGECAFCDGEKGDFHPPHDASPHCESGKRSHCSCDTCF
jgi:hypothetical protein